MAAKTEDMKALWVSWTQDALGLYSSVEGLEDGDDLVEDAVSFATEYADAMLTECQERFDGGPRRKKVSKKKVKRRPAREEPDDDDDDDDEEDD